MKEIQIYTATADNGGVRREAGSLLSVGSAKESIAQARAQAMVDAATAAEVNATKASAKKSAD